MSRWMERIRGLLQWFWQLTPEEHRHWCMYYVGEDRNPCKHTSSCWMCNGITCSDMERKNCPACEVVGAKMEAIAEQVAPESRKTNWIHLVYGLAMLILVVAWVESYQRQQQIIDSQHANWVAQRTPVVQGPPLDDAETWATAGTAQRLVPTCEAVFYPEPDPPCGFVVSSMSHMVYTAVDEKQDCALTIDDEGAVTSMKNCELMTGRIEENFRYEGVVIK
jgi:hypothetical protein